MVEHRGERFVRKCELHATLVASRDQYDGAAIAEAARGMEFTVRPSGLFRLVRRGERRSLIELARVDGQEEFCVRLEDALGLPRNAVPRMAGHVTLFTEPGGGGIALYSDADLAALSVEADLTLDPSPWRLDGDGAILGA